MTCQRFRSLLQAYHDNELDVPHILAVDEHLAGCAECVGSLRALTSLRSLTRTPELRHRAPNSLRQSLRAAIEQTRASETAAGGGRKAPAYAGWAAAVVLLAASVVAIQMVRSRQESRLASELAGGHIRSLMAAHLTDVESSDRHTVKPWFAGKLPFAPPVRDFREDGFPLLGGRLDFIDGQPAAAVVYGRNKHVINLFIWPSSAGEAPLHIEHSQGYQIARWSQRGMNFNAVSDLNAAELTLFASEWRKPERAEER